MTPATAGPPPLFSMFSRETTGPRLSQSEAFVFSLLGQALIVALLTYFTCCVIGTPPGLMGRIPKPGDRPLIFSGHSGGGGGNFEKLPASHGGLPRVSLADQVVPPAVILPREPPKLAAEETVRVAPDVKLPQDGQIGDPMSRFPQGLSNGPGGPGGMGNGCCGGIGPSTGPGVGDGPPGTFSPGKGGVTVPQVIYSPEPVFSDEARKAKQQGVVTLLLVVGKDGRPYNIRVWQSLGMGLDDKAVATQIEVEVDFHLY